jgi:hypothetical protein
MNFTVEWTPTALQELADLWNTATNRTEVTAASNAIDARLARDPLSAGEAHGGIGGVSRIYFHLPFAVLFDVYETNQRVVVWAIWRPF